jgi:hypothetical protein
MALYPGAIQRPIPPGANDPRVTVIGAILHTDAGNSKSLFGYFNGPSGGIESHFHIPKVGKPEQYRDTAWEADANLHGNSFLLNGKLYGYASIETQGYATDEWNPYQLAEIKKLLLWLSQTHKFPLVKCASATSPGVGYHTMWGAPGPWTPVAKDCPGAKRIKQFGNTLVPWFQTTAPPKDGFTVAEADRVIEFIRQQESTPGIEGQRYSDLRDLMVRQHAELLTAIQALTAALQQKG